MAALALGASVVAAACGAQDALAQAASAVPHEALLLSPRNQQGPATADHLRIGIWNTAGNVTTYTIGNSWNDWVLWLVFDKLKEPSPYVGEAEPWLATSVEQIRDDARTWETKLRDGVRWHDGTTPARRYTRSLPAAPAR
jgi:peptide/nickel transport system substrate-binding protein